MNDNLVGIARLKLIDLLRGTKILETLKELRLQQFYSKTKLNEINNAKLSELFRIATTSTEFYSKYSEVDQINAIGKETIKNNTDSFVSRSFKNKLYKKATGGSTGSPLVYYTTAESISYMWAGIVMSWEVAGYTLGDKVAFLAGTSIIKKDLKHDIFYKLMNIDVYSTYTLNEQNVIRYIKNIRSTKVKIIYGYATAIAFAAETMAKYKIEPLQELKGIVSTAEVLTEESRIKIERSFKVKVYNQYGCNEGGVSAFECEKGKMHLISVRCAHEVDHEGNLIATDLTNKGFIMMKYITGDQIELSDDQSCSCKRNFPIIKNIKGRSYDMVIDSQLKIMHAAFFNILFKNDETIKQFQVQFNKNKISILLNTDKSGQYKNDYQHYIESIKKHLSFSEYEIILDKDFLNTSSSKHRYVINTEV